MKVKQTKYFSSKEILYNDDYSAFAHQINDEDIVENSDKQKIVKAGTPIGPDGKKAVTTSGKSNAIGILLSDCDVTYGSRPASLLYRGCIVKNKIPEELAQEVLNALPQIRLF